MALSPPTELTDPRPERRRLDGSQVFNCLDRGWRVETRGWPRAFQGGPFRRPCISEWRPARTPASRTPLRAGKAPELMSCNYPLRRAAAGRLLFAFAAASSSPARPRPAAALRVPARGSAAASFPKGVVCGANEMASKGDDPPPIPLELDGFLRVGSGCPKDCAEARRAGTEARARGSRGRGVRSSASRASGARAPAPLPSWPRGGGWRARPRRSLLFPPRSPPLFWRHTCA
ncbi:uncharacterized protein LOC110308484 [Mus caroli]|uniref:Uncharacterized protein LOC110308484 n=1 Tax=Mus caroli TaxID=10089 RepID=A0A6P5QR13_MUSCR|nr:uncharacterized protein LOC110308484 [Mus caroli]